MKSIIKQINHGLLITLTILIISGLLILSIGKNQLSAKVFFTASVIVPVFIATQGILFIIENHHKEAFISILLLSVICLLSIVFVFI